MESMKQIKPAQQLVQQEDSSAINPNNLSLSSVSSPEIKMSAQRIVIEQVDDNPYQFGQENAQQEKTNSFQTFQALSAGRPREFGDQITNNMSV